jgi:hypothetical protein
MLYWVLKISSNLWKNLTRITTEPRSDAGFVFSIKTAWKNVHVLPDLRDGGRRKPIRCRRRGRRESGVKLAALAAMTLKIIYNML